MTTIEESIITTMELIIMRIATTQTIELANKDNDNNADNYNNNYANNYGALIVVNIFLMRAV